jgi:XTP/dITP diphosphohydrolase
VRELSALLSTLPVPLEALSTHGAVRVVEETGATCAENARQKAAAYARQLHQWVLADDTALEVDALGGAPGVRSARYAGDTATMAANRAKLLEELAQVPIARRTARFVCHLAVADPAGAVVAEAAGVCRGRIRRQAAAGSFGFGYDCLFEVDGCDRTLAELDSQETAAVGHRARAVRALLGRWAQLELAPSPAADRDSQSR